MKKSRPTAWSGPSRWLFCSLHPSGWASACFTDTLLAGLTSRILAPGPSKWLSLEAEVRDAPLCHSREEPDEPAWHQFHLSPLSPLEQRLLSPSHGSQHMVGSHSGTLFQTRQTPRPSNPWCLCCWLQAVSSGLKVGKYRPVGVQGAAQHPLSSSLPSPWNETKIAFWEMWVFLDNCVSTSIAEKLSSKLQPIWEYCFFAEQNYSA